TDDGSEFRRRQVIESSDECRVSRGKSGRLAKERMIFTRHFALDTFFSTPGPRPLSLFGWKASDSGREKHMKTQISFVLILSWISVAAVHAAQPPGNDVSVRVFNSADVNVPQLKPGEWMSLTFNSERWDTANLHETATNSGRLKAPAAGKYY